MFDCGLEVALLRPVVVPYIIITHVAQRSYSVNI